MNGRDWLVIDTNFVLWREFHGAARREPAAAVLGAMYAVNGVVEDLGCPDVAWAFDRGPYKRAADYPGYKSKRRKVDSPESAAEDELRAAALKLCDRDLPALGYRNVWGFRGYEADDVMAAAALAVEPPDRVILVTRDRDVYQLLGPRCAVYDPFSKTFHTANSFKQIHGIRPIMWAEVKSVSGCSTDDVPGMAGVGEKTALKFLRGELRGSPKHDAILAYNRTPDYALSRKLVTLPYPGCPAVEFKPDPPRDPAAWAAFCARWTGSDPEPTPADVRRAARC